MARYTNEDIISLCDRITAICNRLNKRFDAIEEQQPPTEAYGQQPYASFESSVQQPRQHSYMEWQQLPPQQSWELRPPDPGLPYGAPQYSSEVYLTLTPSHQQGDQDWQPSLHPLTHPSNVRHAPPEYQPPPSPWLSSSWYLQEPHLTQPPQPTSYSNSCWDPRGVYLTQPPYQPPCPPSGWDQPVSVSAQLPFTNTDLYAPLQNSVPPNFTPWQTTAEPYFHNQPPPSHDSHQRPQPSSTTALPQQHYPQLPPPNTCQPPPICLDEKVTISEKESERFSSCGESTIVHEIVKHGRVDYSNSSLGERIIPETSHSVVSAAGLDEFSENMLHKDIKELSVVDVKVNNQVADVSVIAIVSHCSTTLDADARLIPPGIAGEDFSAPIEVPVLDSQVDDGLSSPTTRSVNSQSPSENKVLNERKKRIVAEFRGENEYFRLECGKLVVSDERGFDVGKSMTTRKGRKGNDGELQGAVSEQPSSTRKRGRKRMVYALVSSPMMTNIQDDDADGVNGGILSRKSKEINVSSTEEALSILIESKKSKFLSPPTSNLVWRAGNSSDPKSAVQVENDETATTIDAGAGVNYCVTHILSCITGCSPQYKILMVGGIFGGIATSILFSPLESRLVEEHLKGNFEQQWLSITFSMAILHGNGIVATVAGVLQNLLVSDYYNLGYVSLFEAAAIFLAIGMIVILSSWIENSGDPSVSKLFKGYWGTKQRSFAFDPGGFLDAHSCIVVYFMVSTSWFPP